MIELRNISVSYGPSPIVKNVSASAASGELIALVGPNGSGKSTLLKAVAGLLPHTGSTSLPNSSSERAKTLSYLAQNNTAPDDRSVRDVLALGRTPYLGLLNRLSETDNAAIDNAATSCEIEPLLDRTFGTLSGGEKMRTHLGRALTTQGDILIADEPITALDPYYQISMMNILRKTADSGTTIIAALHDLRYASRFADRIWVMHAGKLVSDNVPEKALSPDILRDVFRISPDGQTIG